MKRFDSADDLRDYLTDLNFGDVPNIEAVGGAVILVSGTPWLAYCTDPDGEWFFECGDPEERMTEDAEGWREYERIGLDWIGPQVDAHGADLLWPIHADDEIGSQ